MPHYIEFSPGMGDAEVGVAVTKNRPNLIRFIGEVAVSWSHLEHVLMRAFGWLVSGDADQLAIYHRARDRGPKDRLFVKAANGILPKPMIAEYQQRSQETVELAKLRNEIVHGVWGTFSARPDSLMLADEVNFCQAATNLIDRMSTIKSGSDVLEGVRFREFRSYDFDAVLGSIGAQQAWAGMFGMRVMSHIRFGDAERVFSGEMLR